MMTFLAKMRKCVAGLVLSNRFIKKIFIRLAFDERVLEQIAGEMARAQGTAVVSTCKPHSWQHPVPRSALRTCKPCRGRCGCWHRRRMTQTEGTACERQPGEGPACGIAVSCTA